MTPANFAVSTRPVLKPGSRLLTLHLIVAGACFSPQGLQAQQDTGSQFVQANPNYVTYPQAKPSPNGYAQTAPQYAAPAPYAQSQPSDPYAGQAPYSAPQPGPQSQYADPQPGWAQGAPQDDQQPPQPFAAQQLEQMLAPIALYPDALVAQILAASTYPAQVVAADNWLHSLGYASPDQIAYGASAQTSWDPSIKALTAFPQVLDLMNHDLAWTTDLGNAYYNQPQDVLDTIQVLRQRAQDAGTLQNTPQQTVSDNQGYIQLAPANPAVVYVPQYNPWVVYGQPVAPYPGFSLFGALAAFADSGAVRYGLGFAMGAFSHTPFGWAGWALNWLTSDILFNHAHFDSRSTSVAHWGRYGQHGFPDRTPNRYGRPEQGFNRGASGRPGDLRQPLRTQSNLDLNRGALAGREYGNPAYGNHGYGNFVRPAQQNHGWNQPRPAPPQSYSRPGVYGYGNSMQAYAAHPSAPSAGWPAYRAPAAQSFQRNEFAQRAYAEPRSFGGRNYAEPRPPRGNAHMFGGGHQEHFKAPKAPRMSNGGGHHGSSGRHGR